MPAPTTLSSGRYQLCDRLGAGGMASVWLAHDDLLARDVAVKVIADTAADDPEWRKRFVREARAAAAITHPNVVPVFDFGFDDERPYLVMKYIPGPSLAAAIRDGIPIDAKRLACELLDAVAHVHSAGIVHRDIKPSNVLLDDRGSAHLSDFGIAQSPDATALTQTGMIIGTAGYLAPEVAAGQPATVASDLYSTGRVIAEIAAAMNTTSLDPLVDRLTATEPEARDATATNRTVRRRPRASAAADATAPTRVKRSGTTRRHKAQLLGAVAGIVVALGLIVLIAGDDNGPAETPAATTKQPAVPSDSAPLGDHLRSLDRAIDRAAAQ